MKKISECRAVEPADNSCKQKALAHIETATEKANLELAGLESEQIEFNQWISPMLAKLSEIEKRGARIGLPSWVFAHSEILNKARDLISEPSGYRFQRVLRLWSDTVRSLDPSRFP